MSGKVLHISIEYASRFTVHGPTNASLVIHAMYSDNVRVTLCGRRPLAFNETDGGITCPKCLAELNTARQPLGPKPERGIRRKRQHPPRDKEGVTQDRRQWQHEHMSLSDDPEVAMQRAATRGLSRSWWITERGHAALEAWEKEEASE